MLTKPEPTDRERAIAAVRSYIVAGGYMSGDRLPPERKLIGDLGVGRTVLRRALDALEREGAIWRHVGKGTFVANHGGDSTTDNSLSDISRQLTPVRVMQARACIEPAIAREAAINASREAIIRMKLAKDRAASAATWTEYEKNDDLFHRAIAEAADNALLLALFDQLNQVRRAVAWRDVVRRCERPPTGHSSFAEHELIADAIEAHEPAAAHEAMRKHIGSVWARLFGEA
jgi:DNA-binding FadR family transcriptional regulator